ncbi:MAG: cyclase family protein [Candidatus Muirbacterium halophilum]|nr:cyclase family protein [Candidatus Muirbacterium halophilum]MCK9476724.1 cyclase family protein [Candidatus Muirbacterium halophilum]
MIIDLTMNIDKNTPVYPGDTSFIEKATAIFKRDGNNVTSLYMSNHFGTHIDSPLHMLENGKKLDEYNIEDFVGLTTLIDCHDKVITENCIPQSINTPFLFIRTLWWKNYKNTKLFYSKNPVITPKCAQKIASLNIKGLILDSWTPDNFPYEAHKILFKNNIFIVENTINSDNLPKQFKIYALPIKLTNANGAPARVIAEFLV